MLDTLKCSSSCSSYTHKTYIPVILDQVTTHSHSTDFNAVMQGILPSIHSGCTHTHTVCMMREWTNYMH